MPDNLPKKPSTKETPPPEDVGRSIGGWMIALLWLLLLGGGTLLAQQWLQKRQAAQAPVWRNDATGQTELILQANRYGQYLITGSTNEQEVHFLLDTGASEISIPAAVAQQLNLKRGRGYTVSTANGSITVFSTKLDRISIGPFTLNNVQAHVNPSMEGEVALLGMSFLRHFDLVQRDGTLTISAP